MMPPRGIYAFPWSLPSNCLNLAPTPHAIAMPALLIGLCFAALAAMCRHATNKAKRKLLLLHEDGRRQLLTDSSSEDDAMVESHDLILAESPHSVTDSFASYEKACLAASFLPLGGPCNDEHRVARSILISRCVAVYMHLLQTNVLRSSGTWWVVEPSDPNRKRNTTVNPCIDPDNVLCGIAALARRHSVHSVEDIAFNDTHQLHNAVRAVVGVGHKLCARLDVLDCAQGQSLALAICDALGMQNGHAKTRQKEQMMMEVSLCEKGYSFSCTAFNLPECFAHLRCELNETQDEKTTAFVCSVSKVLSLAVHLHTANDLCEEIVSKYTDEVLVYAFYTATYNIVLEIDSLVPHHVAMEAVVKKATRCLLQAAEDTIEVAYALLTPIQWREPNTTKLYAATRKCIVSKVLGKGSENEQSMF